MSDQKFKLAQPPQKQTRIKGAAGEQKACEWLESKGFKILARNYCTQFGEIDIIALRDDVLHFIEVKTFLARSLSPRYAITAKKLQKIYASIDVLLFTCRNLQPNQAPNSPKTHKSQNPSKSPKQCSKQANATLQNNPATPIITQALQTLHIDLQNCQYCVDALLIWGDSIELLENISLETSYN